MDFERLTPYQIESYFTQLAYIYLLKLTKYVVFPQGVYINEKNSLHVVAEYGISLHQLMYSKEQVLSPYTKLQILIQTAKIINTFHRLSDQPLYHGHLTPHNIFVSIQSQNGAELVKVKIDGFENGDLKKYASTLYNYRTATVYSSPEVLRQPKIVQKPSKSMDVYSFGVIVWQLYHG